MNAHIPYCLCKNQFPLDTCENCEDYHSRSRRTQGDRVRSMNNRQLAEFLAQTSLEAANMEGNGELKGKMTALWLDWLRKEAE